MLTNKIKAHWEDRAVTYHSNVRADFTDPPIYARWKRLIFPLLESADPLCILDAGCGTGVLSHIAATHGTHRIVAADLSKKMIHIAKSNLEPWQDRIQFLCRDVTALPSFPDAHFDLIISRYLVWTLPQPETALKEWYRLLKPGGKVVIIDGNWYRAYYTSLTARGWMKCVDLYYRIRNRKLSGQRLASHYAATLPHTHLLRPDWDVGLLTGLGFKPVTIQHNLHRIIYAGSMKQLIYPFSTPFMIQAIK